MNADSYYRPNISHVELLYEIMKLYCKPKTAPSVIILSAGKTEQEGSNYRLYDLEVLEFNNDVSFLLVMPPVESVCNSPFDAPDQQTVSHDCTYVPVQAFEMRKFTSRYFPNYNYFRFLFSLTIFRSLHQVRPGPRSLGWRYFLLVECPSYLLAYSVKAKFQTRTLMTIEYTR